MTETNDPRAGSTWLLASLRRRFRSSEAALILLAIAVGAIAGIFAAAQNLIAHATQSLLYGLDGERLSASEALDPLRLLALPVGGLLLALLTRAAGRRWRAPVDVVEANALHGGAVPFRDTALVAAQTLISNGFGASVGLEAAYAQAGGGAASILGRALRLRRADMRVMVGAGAGAAIGAAFGAPLTGAFYAFEIVIGAYTAGAIAPVAAAALAAVLVVRALGLPAYVVALPGSRAITAADYALYAALGLGCGIIGVLLMRAVTALETVVHRIRFAEQFRPVIGGMLLIPIALISPQALSSGHGALHLDLTMQVGIGFLATIFAVKFAASAVSLGFGFRGGLFFASLFLGSLVGQIFAAVIAAAPVAAGIDPSDAALIGMAALGVAVVGGPMTMAMLVLETTHDLALTGVALTAGLCAGTLVRETFGFSFSTWRLHTRGETIRSARDVGWIRSLTAGRMMRSGGSTVPEHTTIAEFRRRFPLGSVGRVVLTDQTDRYAGIVVTASAHAAELEPEAPVGGLAVARDVVLSPDADVRQIMRTFDESETDDLAVLDADRRVIGTLSERFVRRRYTDEIEKAQRELFGE